MRIEADGASPAEVAAIVAALDALSEAEPFVSGSPAQSRWKSASRAVDDGYDVLRASGRHRNLNVRKLTPEMRR